MSYQDLNYNQFLYINTSGGLPAEGITNANVDSLIASGAISFDRTTANVLKTNQAMQSENYITGISGWKITGEGAAEFQTLSAKHFISVYAQDYMPSGGTYTQGDLWYDTDDNNKRYVYINGAWVVDTSSVGISGWSQLLDDDPVNHPKPADGATVGATWNFNITGQPIVAYGDTGGNLITDVINSKFNTESRQILDEFVFGASGAIRISSDVNNGLWLSPTGILGKKSGATTFALDNSGNATFSGDITGSTGTFGAVIIAQSGLNINSGAGNMFSDNYVEGVSGWIIRGDGSAEFQTLLANEFVKVFAQDSAPTSGMTAGDFWYDTNDGNKRYIYRSGAWIVDTGISAWSTILDDDGHKPDNDATVGAIAGTNLRDSNSVILGDTEVKNIGTYQLGEALDAGDIVCSKLTDALLASVSEDTFVFQNSPTSKYGAEGYIELGYGDPNYLYRSFVKIDTTGLPADVYNIAKVYLRLYFLDGGWYPTSKSSFSINVKRITSAWDELTATYNAQPTTTDYISMTLNYTNDYLGNGYVDIDITTLVIAWIEGVYTNYGIALEKTAFESNNEHLAFESAESPVTAHWPKTYYAALWAADDKIYGASCDDYYLCRTIIGYLLESGSTNDYCKVQMMGLVSHAVGDTGMRYFLSSTGSGMVASNMPTGGDRAVAIGFKPTENTFLLDIQRRDILIGTPAAIGTRHYVIGDARYALADGKKYPKGISPWDSAGKYTDGLTNPSFYN
jgi:hypothetical protein